MGSTLSTGENLYLSESLFLMLYCWYCNLTHPHFTKENHASISFLCPQLAKGIANGNVSVVSTSCFCHAAPSDLQGMHAVMQSEVHMQAAGLYMPAGSYSRIASSLTFCPAQLLALWSS